jgi:hypothetical protein
VAAGRQRPHWLGGHHRGQSYHQLQAKLSVEPQNLNVGKREGRGGEKLVSEWRSRYFSMALELALQSFRHREESRAVRWRGDGVLRWGLRDCNQCYLPR